MTTTFKFGIGSPTITPNSLTLNNQSVDSDVVNNDPVYFNSQILKWKKSINIRPRGVAVNVNAGSADIVLSGLLTTSGLTADTFYFLDTTSGGLTTTESSIKIGKSTSISELLVDIDVVGLLRTDIAGYISHSSTFEKLLFANDNIVSVTTSIADTLEHPGIGNNNLMSFLTGGQKTAPSLIITTIRKFLFSDESVSTNSTSLGTARWEGAGFSNLSDSYYVSGATDVNKTASTDVVEKINFTSENVTNLSTLATARSGLNDSGFTSSTTGYINGGAQTDLPLVLSSNIDQLTFSNDSNAASGIFLTTARRYGAGVNNNSSGFYLGGQVAGSPDPSISSVEKFIFSTSANASVSTSLINARKEAAAAISNTAGYSIGGVLTVATSSINKFLLFSETNSSISSTLSNSFNSGGVGFEHISF